MHKGWDYQILLALVNTYNRGFIISHLSSSGDAGQGIASLVVAIISLSARLRAMHVKDVVEQGSGGLQDRS